MQKVVKPSTQSILDLLDASNEDFAASMQFARGVVSAPLNELAASNKYQLDQLGVADYFPVHD